MQKSNDIEMIAAFMKLSSEISEISRSASLTYLQSNTEGIDLTEVGWGEDEEGIFRLYS